MFCLLVDDEPGIREGFAMLLRRKGHQVLTAGDCAAARDLLRQHEFDQVITDWRLPDGTAADFVGQCACPVIAISGHPEEVASLPGLRAVLTKPTTPGQLLDLLATGIAPALAPTQAAVLPRDVQAVVDRARAIAGGPVHIDDDGDYLYLSAALSCDAMLLALEDLGGDLRVLAPAGALRWELRLCRDGRPEAGLPVVAANAAWPATGDFGIDFAAATPIAVELAALQPRVAERARCGDRIYYLNLPPALHSWTSHQGNTDGMPIRAKVGPRLPAVFADLWS
jgi:CheY-like chemotaxis protein